MEHTDANHADLAARFPELHDAEDTLHRISEAFVAPEYARAGFALMRHLVRKLGGDASFGRETVITAPHDYSNIIVTVGRWWLLNFHIAEAEALEEGDDVEEIAPVDYEQVLEEEKNGEVRESGDDEEIDPEDFDEDDFVEATFYQVGTVLLDSTFIGHEDLFEREDLEFYAYDFPEERISAERFYWARMVWEPQDLLNEALVASIESAANHILTNFPDQTPFAEFHDHDFALLISNEELCERAIGAADFGDVIVIEGDDDGE